MTPRRSRLARIIPALVLAVATALPASVPALAAPGDMTTGTLTLVPTHESVGVYASFSGDSDGDSFAYLEYRASGSASWIRAMDMTRDTRATVGGGTANPYRNQWRASILGLWPGASYEVRVAFSDPDGVNGPNPVVAGVTTRRDVFPTPGNTYYVDTAHGSASDSNPGTEALPFKTIPAALDVVAPGDTVYVKAGTYPGGITLTTPGTPGNYIALRGYPGDVVNINAVGQSYGFFIQDSYIVLSGFNVLGGSRGVRVGPYYGSAQYGDGPRDQHEVVIEDMVLQDPKTMASAPSKYVGILLGGTSVNFLTDMYDITVQRNVITLVEPGTSNQGLVTGPAIWMQNANGGHVIRDNRITYVGTVPVHGMDGIVSSPNFNLNNTIHDSDIYRNYIDGATDDGISLDGNAANVRVWGNTIKRTNIGISIAPILVGPVHIFRNVWVDPQVHWVGVNRWVKGGEDGTGYAYFYHNTVVWDRVDVGLDPGGSGKASSANYGFGLGAGSGAESRNVISRNNILLTNGPVVANNVSGPDMDYDLIWNRFETASYRPYWIQWGGTKIGNSSLSNAENLALFQQSKGQEGHGVAGPPVFVDRAGGDYRLAAGSPGVDQGVIITGFNDAASPWPYSGLAPDMGAFDSGTGAPVNQPPSLDTVGDGSVAEGQLLQFILSATDPDGDSLTYSASGLPSGASFDPQTRTFSWTPPSGSAGTYTGVRFEVSDGALSDAETVSIVVNASVNGAPVLNPIGGKAAGEGQLLAFTLSATDPDGDSLAYSASGLPSGASFDPQTRTFSWTPASGTAGSYPVVRFEVSDGQLTDAEDVTITVSGGVFRLRVNAAGVAYTDMAGNQWQADQAYSAGSWGYYGAGGEVDRGTSLAIGGTNDDRIYQTERYGLGGYRFDLPNGTYAVTLHFAETYRTGPGQRVFDVSVEGQLVLNDLDVYAQVGRNAALVQPLGSVSVQDGQLEIAFVGSVEQPLINGIEITGHGGTFNSAPVLGNIGDRSVVEGSLLEFTVSATDSDGDSLIYSASNLPEGAEFDVPTQTFSWTPDSASAGSYSGVTFHVSDGTLTDSEEITITVTAPGGGGGGVGGGGVGGGGGGGIGGGIGGGGDTNHPPVLYAVGDRTVRSGRTLSFTVTASDPDGDAVTVSVSNLPAGASFDAQTGAFSWAPDSSQVGDHPGVHFEASDGALSDSEDITISVLVNGKPEFQEIGGRAVRSGDTIQFMVSATDPDGDTVTYSASNLPEGAAFDEQTATFTWTPDETQAGSHPGILFEATDGDLVGSEEISITVLTGGNNAPVLDSIGDRTVAEGELLEFTVTGADPEGDPLAFGASNLPAGAVFGAATASFSWTPQAGQAGTYDHIHFEVSDGSLVDTEHVTITVTAPASGDGGFGGGFAGGGGGGVGGGGSTPAFNNPPQLGLIGDRGVAEGDALSFTITASDPDEDALTFSASNLPPGASFDAQTATFTWEPAAGQAGNYQSVRFEVSDGDLVVSAEISIKVQNGDDVSPAITEVVAAEVTTVTAEICWTTDEPSTSQVEYWASPGTLTPVDEELVTHHVVLLTGLRPGTVYAYRTISVDDKGNVAASEPSQFATPATEASFSVGGLTVEPSEAEVGEEAVVSVLVTNTSHIPGSYEVALTVGGVLEGIQNVVGLAGGASQRVSFPVTRSAVGTYAVDVNGLPGSFVVTGRAIREPTIIRFAVSPTYNSDTGTLAYATILYEVAGESTGIVEVVLSINVDGVPLPEVNLLSSVLTGAQPVVGSMDYTPQSGWGAGTYTFRAELRTEDGSIVESPERTVSVTSEAAVDVVSWWTLGMIVGSMLFVTLLVVLLVLHRRRDMLRDWAGDA